jgi:hypothetical protein
LRAGFAEIPRALSLARGMSSADRRAGRAGRSRTSEAEHMIRALALLLAVPALARAADPIPNVTAKATSEQVKNLYGAQNLCSDTGLGEPDNNGNRALAKKGSVWHSGYIALGGDENPTVQFDLGKVYDVGRFHVWNHNANPHRGFKHVSVFTSEDGKTWQPVAQRFTFAKAPGADGYLGESHEFAPAARARYVRFFCDGTHRTGGNRELAGLGKVRFYEATKKGGEVPSYGGGAFPDAAGAVNVKLPPYGAKGDGTADDTAAIQKAIDDWQGSGRTLVLPAGTYLVSAPLRYAPGKGYGYNNLRGAGAHKTTIRLKDGTFTDGAKPLPVLSLGFNGKPDGKGVHADWFNNNVSDFTIDTGRGNPGAIALQYYSNNAGALRDVALVSRDAKGHTGLDLGYADQNGPCLVKGVTVDGFATSVRSGATVNSQTAEHVTVSNCAKVGWENGGQCLSIRGLKVSGTGAGFVSAFGVVALVDCEFAGTGAAKDLPAVSSGETLFARNIKTTGYKLAIENRRKNDNPTPSAAGPNVDEWVSTAPLTLFPVAQPRSLNLPIRETPDVPWDDVSSWANVRAYRELADPDDSASLQRAIDSGATTVYLPAGGAYYFGAPVELRGKVRRVVGTFAQVHGIKGDAVWRVSADGPETLVLQDVRGHLTIEHGAAKRAVVVKNGQGTSGKLTGGGDLFLDNVVAEWDFEKGRAWGRQYNNEREGTHVSNRGAALWILGYKTERGGTLIETTNGGATEVLGGLSYTTTKGKLAPMFVSKDSRVSVVMGEVCYTGDPFARLFEQTRGADTKALDRKGAPLRPAFLQGGQLPPFVAEP